MSHAYGNAPVGIMDPPSVVLPEAGLFAERAQRLKGLSETVEPLSDFLAFMGQVAHAQHRVLETSTPTWLPEPDAFDMALKHGMPPLGIDALKRDIDVKSELAALLDALELHVGDAQRPLLDQLRGLEANELQSLIEDILDRHPGDPSRRGVMPLVAAAMQVAWVRMAQRLPRAPERPESEARALCPCCGSAPSSSIIQIEQERSGVRYLVCGLCATQWYLERSKCSVCDQSGKISYLGLEDEAGEQLLPVQAETCGDCHSYLKIVLRESDAQAEPIADDLASLALDLLLAEEGEFQRSGYNPLFIAEG
ncbi:formate dehydrogenase accessory protein FdhE [Litchfieldella xinjiangensis]|uniref:formate dehydrogenase accessory protein FdhE n=1 Tax=Litchfieldella xinjiangensis TaxID=1166948 RepID=UPI000B2E36EE|nr:formate dehydrogenase accessory protein FdhE [Halomonas xinjiangensis]